MFMSLEMAEHIFHFANYFLVSALAVGVAATYAIYVASDVKEKYANEKSKEADLKIAEAAVEVAKVGKLTEEAKATSDIAKAEAAKATTETARLQKEAASLKKDADVARLELARIQEKLAPRRLSDAAKGELINALKPFKGQKCVISYALADAESDVYANDFVKVLEAAGWDHDGPRGIRGVIWSAPVFGIQIWIPQAGPDKPSSVVTTPGILALIEVMGKLKFIEGTPQGIYTDPSIPFGTVEIRIGTK